MTAWMRVFGMVPGVKTAELPPYSRGDDPIRDPFDAGNADLAVARRTHRRVPVELGEGCYPWCQTLDRFVSDNHDVREALRARFVVLTSNVSDANGGADLLARLPPSLGHSQRCVARPNGNFVHSRETAQIRRKRPIPAPVCAGLGGAWAHPGLCLRNLAMTPGKRRLSEPPRFLARLTLWQVN